MKNLKLITLVLFSGIFNVLITAQENLAIGKTITSTNSRLWNISDVLDGDITTYGVIICDVFAYNTPMIFTVDLGSNYNLSSISINLGGEFSATIGEHEIRVGSTLDNLGSLGYNTPSPNNYFAYNISSQNIRFVQFEIWDIHSSQPTGVLEIKDIKVMGYRPVLYAYDAAGNRIRRYLDIQEVKSANGEDFKPKTKTPLNWDELGIKLYPNPTQGELIIEFENYPEKQKLRMELYDFAGKKIVNEKIRDNRSLLNMETYPEGNYMLRLFVGGEVKTYQIIKN